MTGNCESCHNGTHALAKTKADKTGHVTTSAQCDTCHVVKYTDWTGATGFDHSGVTSGCSASNCHNDADTHTRKRPTDHVGGTSQTDMTTATCENCHGYSATAPKWLTVCRDTDNSDCMSHADTTVASKTCVTCHTSSKSPTYVQRYKNATTTVHPNTTNNCQNCHNKNSSSKGVNGWKTNCNEADGNADCMQHTEAMNPANDYCTDCHYSSNPWGADILPSSLCSGGLGECAATGEHPNVGGGGQGGTVDFCGDCHTSRTGWAAYTPFKHARVIGSGTASLCHDCHYDNSHSNNWSNRLWDTPEGHIALRASGATNCHSCHKSTDTANGWKPNCVGGTSTGYDTNNSTKTCEGAHAQIDTAVDKCQNCHLADARWQVPTRDNVRLTTSNFNTTHARDITCPQHCGTCHKVTENYWGNARGTCTSPGQ